MRSLLTLSTVLLSGTLAVACGDSTGTTSGGGSGGSSTTTSSGGTATGGAGTGGTSTGGNSTGGAGTGGAADIPVVINEISAVDTDYIELVNAGAQSFDLSDYALAGTLTAGEPDVATAARFPAGSSLAAGDHLLILAKQDPTLGVGPHDMCLPPDGPSSCFYATWGISDSKGETVFLLSPTNVVVAVADYPMNATLTGTTWGRLPDATGAFAVNAPTPGAINKAP